MIYEKYIRNSDHIEGSKGQHIRKSNFFFTFSKPECCSGNILSLGIKPCFEICVDLIPIINNNKIIILLR